MVSFTKNALLLIACGNLFGAGAAAAQVRIPSEREVVPHALAAMSTALRYVLTEYSDPELEGMPTPRHLLSAIGSGTAIVAVQSWSASEYYFPETSRLHQGLALALVEAIAVRDVGVVPGLPPTSVRVPHGPGRALRFATDRADLFVNCVESFPVPRSYTLECDFSGADIVLSIGYPVPRGYPEPMDRLIVPIYTYARAGGLSKRPRSSRLAVALDRQGGGWQVVSVGPLLEVSYPHRDEENYR
jgi:hypothetical protein